MRAAVALLLALLPVLAAAQGLPVEPGSGGNLVTVYLANDHDRIPLQGLVVIGESPPFVERWRSELEFLVPPLSWPGELGRVAFSFDVDPSAAPGDTGSVRLDIVRAPGDTLRAGLLLEVVPASPLAADVEVVFRADMADAGTQPGSVVEAIVDESFAVALADDGMPPDDSAGDGNWSGSTVFAAGSSRHHRFHLELDGVAECDSNVTPEQRVFRVEEALHDASGNPQLLGPSPFGLCTVVATPPGGALATLVANRPNPFGSSTQLAWRQSSPATVELVLYDARGRRVARPLPPTPYPAGEHILAFGGFDQGGRRLASGVYHLRLRVGGRIVDSRALLLLR